MTTRPEPHADSAGAIALEEFSPAVRRLVEIRDLLRADDRPSEESAA